MVASGRTDARVHALGQVVSCRVDTALTNNRLLCALNANLPSDIRLLRVEDASDDFHALKDARRKRYRYLLQTGFVSSVFLRHYSWFVRGTLDLQAMQTAAASLTGCHDFAAYQSSGSPRATTRRTVLEFSVHPARMDDHGDSDSFLAIEIEANGFLYHMVRNLTGTLVEVGQGRQSTAWPMDVLRSRDRRAAGRTAPPQGLCLVHVQYD